MNPQTRKEIKKRNDFEAPSFFDLVVASENGKASQFVSSCSTPKRYEAKQHQRRLFLKLTKSGLADLRTFFSFLDLVH